MPSNRMLFGTRGDTFGDDKSALKMRSMMTKQFQGVFPNWNDIDVEYYWRGTVVMNRDLVPAFGSLENDKSVFFSYGYHANGNNSTVYCGKKLAEMSKYQYLLFIDADMIPENPDYIKTRNQYRIYLLIYLIIFILYQYIKSQS